MDEATKHLWFWDCWQVSEFHSNEHLFLSTLYTRLDDCNAATSPLWDIEDSTAFGTLRKRMIVVSTHINEYIAARVGIDIDEAAGIDIDEAASAINDGVYLWLLKS